MTESRNWFVHIGDEIFGPVATEVVNVMLRQTRLQFTDFIWSEGLTKWVRIIDVDDFTRLLPPYPASSIPSSTKNVKVRIPEPQKAAKTEEKSSDFSSEEDRVELPIKKSDRPSEGYRTGGMTGKALKPGLKLSAFPRIRLQGKVDIKGYGKYKAVDISEGGVFVAAAEFIEIGTEVEFSLEAEMFPEKLAMTGVVIRHGDRHDEKGFAVEFMRVNPAYKRLIREAIAKESSQSEK